MKNFDLILRGGRCVLPWREEITDVGVIAGRISEIGDLRTAKAQSVIDCRGLHVLPGLTDAHVHLRDPGDPTVETMEAGTKGAVLGGLTSIFDMPNTAPPLTSKEALDTKRDYAEGRNWCDIGFYVSAANSNVSELGELEREANVCGVKLFAGGSTGDLLVPDDETIEKAMRNGRRRMSFHAEDEYRVQERKKRYVDGNPHRLHPEWRDLECAMLGTRRIIALARKCNRQAHILHVSTAEELDYLKDCRDIATVEVLVNHLTQTDEAYDRLGGFAVMNPPIRSERHKIAAWEAIANGTVDVVGSDHAPHSRFAKERPWPQTSAGLTGVQTLVPIMLDHVSAGRLSLSRLTDLMAAGPARVYGSLCKGRLAAGYDADFTVVDMKKERIIEESWIVSPCGWTPFAGHTCKGWPVMTIVRGDVVMREDSLLGTARGKPIRFTGCR
jgi:dihydroorotase